LLVGILDPCHNLLVGAHIGSEAINGGSNEALLDELHSVAASGALKLSLAQGAGINLYATLGTTEGDVGDRQFEGHKRGESFSFLEIHIGGVSGATLHWESVVTVLSSVASDGLDSAIVTTERNIESNDSVACLDKVQVLLGDVSFRGSAIEEELDLLEEARLLEGIKLGTEVSRVNACCLGEESSLRVEDSSSLLHLVELVDLLHFLWYLEFVNDKI